MDLPHLPPISPFLSLSDVSGAESTGSIQSFVCDATRDRDVRVRISALEGLREIGQLQVEHYSVVKEVSPPLSQKKINVF